MDDFTKGIIKRTYGLSDGDPHLENIYKYYDDHPGTDLLSKAPGITEGQQWEKKTEGGTLAPPPTDARYQQLLDNQVKAATEFRNNIPQLAETFMGQIAEVNKKNLATQIDQTQKNYNKRGLLYSTARQGAEGADRTASAQDLAQKRSQVNSQLYGEADQLDQNAINTGFGIASQGQSVAGQDSKIQNAYLDLALKKQQQDMAALSGVGKSVGTGVGYASGYLSSKSNGLGSGGFQTTNPVTQPATVGYQET